MILEKVGCRCGDQAKQLPLTHGWEQPDIIEAVLCEGWEEQVLASASRDNSPAPLRALLDRSCLGSPSPTSIKPIYNSVPSIRLETT